MNKKLLALMFFYFISLFALLDFNLKLGKEKKPSEVTKIHTPVQVLADTKNSSFVILATGDVMLGRTVNLITTDKNDFRWPFLNISNMLKRADVALINLESPLGINCAKTNEGLRFCADTRFSDSLKETGVDIATISNNHIGDQGVDGFNITKSNLKEKGIATTGHEDPIIREVKGTKVAFISFNDIPPYQTYINNLEEDTLIESIHLAKSRADIVVVSFHWGIEYTKSPTKRQTKFAHLAVDEGADLIIGHHPHWIQDIEIYQGKYIVYSLGNLIFDQMWSQETREGLIAEFVFENKSVVKANFLPIIIENYGQPRFATEVEKQEILSDIFK